MRISLDAMGSDGAPGPEVAGAVAAVERDSALEVLLVGDRDAIGRSLASKSSRDEGARNGRVRVVHTSESISSNDLPISALRRNPRSSIAIGVELTRSGEADAFVSAGSTGAVMAASLLGMRPLAGVERPALAAPFPSRTGKTLVLDVGANLQCKPRHLVQFAHMAMVYMQDVEGVENPRVGLLNVGAEEMKGTGVLRRTHRLLAESGLNFVGNVEGRYIVQGVCDVLVCDGLNGNVLLKFLESLACFMRDSLHSLLDSQTWKAGPEELFRTLDYAEYGGVPLLGLNGVSVVCHGRSSPRAIETAIGVATRAVRTGVVGHMARELSVRGAAS